MHPISWIPSDMPLCMDSVYTDSGEDYDQSPPFTVPYSSRLKGKQPEHDSNPNLVYKAPTQEHRRFCLSSSPTKTEGEFSDPIHPILVSEQVYNVAGTSLTPRNHLELGLSVASGTGFSPNNFPTLSPFSHPSQGGPVLPYQLSSSLPSSHDIECSLTSWAPVSLTPSHAPIPDLALYTPDFSCSIKEPMARYESPESFDCASDSTSDTSDSTTHTSFVWVGSEPSSPEVFITLQDDFSPFLTIDGSDVPLLFDSSVANVEVTVGSLLGGSRPTLKTSEPVPTYHKRKRLFFAEEDEHGERAHKQPRIEQ